MCDHTVAVFPLTFESRGQIQANLKQRERSQWYGVLRVL